MNDVVYVFLVLMYIYYIARDVSNIMYIECHGQHSVVAAAQ